jgi:chemotaxis protein MotB
MKPKKQQSGGSDAAQAGLRTLCVALFIILLAFFIVLNSIGVIDERRKLEALGSLVGTFGLLPSGMAAFSGEGVGLGKPTAPMEKVSQAFPESGAAGTLGSVVTRKFGLGLPGTAELTIRSTPTENIVSIQDQLVFDKGRYRIKRSSYGFLKKLCDIINQDTYPVEITGHTDSIPADEKAVGSNWEISSLRAMEVLKFFVAIGKVDPERIIAYGCAKYRPVASNETRQTRAQNRRVDIVLDHRSRQRLEQIYKEEPSGFFVFKRFVFSIFD